MPPRRNTDINDVYDRIMAGIEERLDQFINQFVNRMNEMMNPRRHGDREGRRGEGEELEYPFFEGDGSSFDEWGDYGVADDDYEEAPIFDDDQYEDVIEEEEGFVDTYPNFQEDENNVSFLGVVLGVEEESMPVYDTDIEDVIDGEEDNMEDVVVVANDLCSSKIQTTNQGLTAMAASPTKARKPRSGHILPRFHPLGINIVTHPSLSSHAIYSGDERIDGIEEL
ncbi:hypothetical protein Tco_0328047 [Tanacetum coccineum]